MSPRTRWPDPAYWMLFDGVETVPTTYAAFCYICNDPEYALMGLPLCRVCPSCGGHIPADDCQCDYCGSVEADSLARETYAKLHDRRRDPCPL